MTSVYDDHTALAEEHVRTGRRIVARQRALIARIRSCGRDTTAAESLLVAFERTLAIFEDDLEGFVRRTGGK